MRFVLVLPTAVMVFEAAALGFRRLMRVVVNERSLIRAGVPELSYVHAACMRSGPAATADAALTTWRA